MGYDLEMANRHAASRRLVERTGYDGWMQLLRAWLPRW